MIVNYNCMKHGNISKINHNQLIQEINMLGPWVHGYFNLGNGLIIEDQDALQKKRLFATRDNFGRIISRFYKKKRLSDKTLCDVGCNTGYFLFELYKKFQFKEAVGLEPRKSNLQKAGFIADYFKMPKKRYRLKQFDILSLCHHAKYDIVIMPGVLHHLDNHLNALKNLYNMTRELCIIETQVLTDELNTNEVAEQLELKDKVYKVKSNSGMFGIIGYKLESDRLDGATIHSGIVGIPTTRTLVMMLYHVGFDDVKVYKSEKQMTKQTYKEKSYREFHAVIVVASKYKKRDPRISSVETTLDKIEEKEFAAHLPLKYIESLYKAMIGKISTKRLSGIPKIIFDSEVHYKEEIGRIAAKKLQKKIKNKPILDIIKTFKHAPAQKITFEFAKTCFHQGSIEKALDITTKLINTVNLDWRTVYSSYYLLALINYRLGNIANAKRYNDMALRAHPLYSLARNLKQQLAKS